MTTAPPLSEAEARSALTFLLLHPSHGRSLLLSLSAASLSKYEPLHSLLLLHESRGRAFDLVTNEAEQTIASATNFIHLFRSASERCCTSLLVGYAKLLGQPFFTLMLNWALERTRAIGRPIELDPIRLDGDNPEARSLENANCLGELICATIARAEQAVNNGEVPLQLRRLIDVIAAQVDARFPPMAGATPNGNTPAMTARRLVVFRLLLSPVASLPQLRDLPRAESRSLMLLTKALQTLINGVKFSSKERYMIPLNAYLDRIEPRVSAFLEALRVQPLEQVVPMPPLTPAATDALVDHIAAKLVTKCDEVLEHASRLVDCQSAFACSDVTNARTDTLPNGLRVIVRAYDKGDTAAQRGMPELIPPVRRRCPIRCCGCPLS